jgi:ABC-type nitrate/sulfonate/bicarbonate transport system permease component
MKKEEFPTFLNEQPTIIFGRTGRELLVVAIGLGLAYVSWIRLGMLMHGNEIAIDSIKVIIAAIFVLSSVGVAFIKVATRPLEEWAFVWLFYTIVPKVYIYTPTEVNELTEKSGNAAMRMEMTAFNRDEDFEDD